MKRAMRVATAACFVFVVASSYVFSQAPDEKGKEDSAKDKKVRPLTIDEMPGEWKEVKIGTEEPKDTKVKIKFKDENSKTLALEGKYKDWEQDGDVADGTVTFTRKPSADEMSEKAPKWARDKVAAEGKLKWKLELKAEAREKGAHLEGNWFPGELKWSGAPGSTSGEATYLGPGKPLEVKFKSPNAEVFLYARCVTGLQRVPRFYTSVPMVIQAAFDEPLADLTQEVKVTVGGQELKLTAKRDAFDYRVFFTETVVPSGAAGGAPAKKP
jgi:hypothetical protein